MKKSTPEKIVLLFIRPEHSAQREKTNGVYSAAIRRGWTILPVEQFATTAKIRELTRLWNPIGCIVDMSAMQERLAKVAGLPIILMIHTPLYEPAFYKDAMERFSDSAYLVGVPDELRANYASDGLRDYQAADAITRETIDYIAGEPLVKVILTGHMHYDYDSVFADRIPQLCTDCGTLRVVEFT